MSKVLCEKCGKELFPAAARADGEATFVGYLPHECQTPSEKPVEEGKGPNDIIGAMEEYRSQATPSDQDGLKKQIIIDAQLEMVQGYYNKIFINKLTIEKILNILEKDREFLQQESNIEFITRIESPSNQNGWIDVKELDKHKIKDKDLLTFIHWHEGWQTTIESYTGMFKDVENFRRYQLAHSYTHFIKHSFPKPPVQ